MKNKHKKTFVILQCSILKSTITEIHCLACMFTSLKVCNLKIFWRARETSQMAQWVKNLPSICLQEMQETQVWSLGWEDPLEEGMATHSNILAWRIPWTEEPGGLQSTGSQRVRHNWSNLAHTCKLFPTLLEWIFCIIFLRKPMTLTALPNRNGEGDMTFHHSQPE